MAEILEKKSLKERHVLLGELLSKFLDVKEDETEGVLSEACEKLAKEKFFG